MDSKYVCLGVAFVLLTLVQRGLMQDSKSTLNTMAIESDKDKGEDMDKEQDKEKEMEVEVGGRKKNRSSATPINPLVAPPIIPNVAQPIATPTAQSKVVAKSGTSGFVSIPFFGEYLYIKTSQSLEEANRTCISQGARLLVTETVFEMQAVKMFLQSHMDNSSMSKGVFVGVRADDHFNFRTEFGAPFPGNSGVRWDNNEPSNKVGEYCVAITMPSFRAYDVHCEGHSANIVCERKRSKSPQTLKQTKPT